MKQVILFLMTYVFVFIIYQILIIKKVKEPKKKKRKPKKVKNTKPIEVSILESKYKIDLEKVNYNKLLLIISLVSSLDITIIITLVMIFDNYFLKILVGFLLTFPVIFVSYELIGRYYKKKGMTKND